MLLVRSLRVAFLALLALHLTSAFAAIALLGRMRPALESIIGRNVASLALVEEMLAALAAPNADVPEVQERFHRALEAAERNVTEEDEPEVLAGIRAHAGGALQGDARARLAALDAVRQLGAVNRAAIERADRDAQRLANAGAWAVALLSFVTLATGLVALRQLDKRVHAPLNELYDVLSHAQRGDGLRRCRPPLGASGELAEAMRALNELMDELHEARGRNRPPAEGIELERATLHALLDRQTAATVIVDGAGEIVAANRAALERLAQDDGAELRSALRSGDHEGTGIAAEKLASDRFLCTLS